MTARDETGSRHRSVHTERTEKAAAYGAFTAVFGGLTGLYTYVGVGGEPAVAAFVGLSVFALAPIGAALGAVGYLAPAVILARRKA